MSKSSPRLKVQQQAQGGRTTPALLFSSLCAPRTIKRLCACGVGCGCVREVKKGEEKKGQVAHQQPCHSTRVGVGEKSIPVSGSEREGE